MLHANNRIASSSSRALQHRLALEKATHGGEKCQSVDAHGTGTLQSSIGSGSFRHALVAFLNDDWKHLKAFTSQSIPHTTS
jgi:uncharacterized membrane protein